MKIKALVPGLVAFNVKREAVVFKPSYIIIRYIRKAGLEIAKYRLDAVIVGAHINKCTYVLYKRIEDDRPRPVYEERDVMLRKLPLDMMTL